MITLRNYFPYHCAIPNVGGSNFGVTAWVKVEWSMLAKAAAKALWAGKGSWEWGWSPPWGTGCSSWERATERTEAGRRQAVGAFWVSAAAAEGAGNAYAARCDVTLDVPRLSRRENT